MPKHKVERFVCLGDEWDVAKAWRSMMRHAFATLQPASRPAED